MKKATIAVAAGIATAGCVASNPDSIQPIPISTIAYQALDCPTLAAEDKRVAERLGPMIYYQNRQRSADVAGILLVGLSPTGLGSPEHSAAIAQLKGEREAINTVKISKGCSEPQAPVYERRPISDIRAEAQREQRPQGPAPLPAASAAPAKKQDVPGFGRFNQ